MDKEDTEILFEHTRRLRSFAAAKKPLYNEPHGKHTSVADIPPKRTREYRDSKEYIEIQPMVETYNEENEKSSLYRRIRGYKGSGGYMETQPTVETDNEESDKSFQS